MPKDPRGYITVHDGMPNHPKVEPLTDKAFRLLVTSWCYCAANNTDGNIRQVVWERRSTAKARQELLDAGLVLLADDGVQMRDYLQHQRSAAERAALREKRANAGKLGGRAKANAKQEPGNDVASATPFAKQTPSKLAIYAEAEAETEMTTSSGTSADAADPDEKPKAKAKRGTRIDAHLDGEGRFPMTQRMQEWGRENAPLVTNPALATAEFVAYWQGMPGQRGTKINWEATWKNRMLAKQEQAEQRRPGNVRPLRPGAVQR